MLRLKHKGLIETIRFNIAWFFLPSDVKELLAYSVMLAEERTKRCILVREEEVN